MMEGIKVTIRRKFMKKQGLLSAAVVASLGVAGLVSVPALATTTATCADKVFTFEVAQATVAELNSAFGTALNGVGCTGVEEVNLKFASFFDFKTFLGGDSSKTTGSDQIGGNLETLFGTLTAGGGSLLGKFNSAETTVTIGGDVTAADWNDVINKLVSRTFFRNFLESVLGGNAEGLTFEVEGTLDLSGIGIGYYNTNMVETSENSKAGNYFYAKADGKLAGLKIVAGTIIAPVSGGVDLGNTPEADREVKAVDVAYFVENLELEDGQKVKQGDVVYVYNATSNKLVKQEAPKAPEEQEEQEEEGDKAPNTGLLGDDEQVAASILPAAAVILAGGAALATKKLVSKRR
jgi:hypothetical protein